jgi:hypothetical protein
MADELITPRELSRESLQALFDAAYLDYRLDDDGDVLVRDGYPCYVLLPDGGESKIRLLAFSDAGAYLPQEEKCALANRINDRYLFIRACVNERGHFEFDYTLLTRGGLTRKHLVGAVRLFQSLVDGAVRDFLPRDEDGDNVPGVGPFGEDEDEDDGDGPA